MFKKKNYEKVEISRGNPAGTDAEGSPRDGELIAVLTAAVAAVMGTPAGALCVKSYRRVNRDFPIWNKAGRNDIISSRF